MNTFKRKSLHLMVLVGLTAIGAAGTANATPIVCTEKVSASTPYKLAKTDRNLFMSAFPYQITVSDNSCAAPFPTTKTVQRQQSLRQAVYNDPWAKQKAKAKLYALTLSKLGSSDWRDMNVSPEVAA